MVLTTAGVVALALAALALAYLQLGYHEDVTAGAEYDAHGDDARRVLSRAVHDASADVARTYAWSERRAAVAAVRDDLEPRLDGVRQAGVQRSVATTVTYNHTAAAAWARDRCPVGTGRAFGACVADGGVVVQERAGRTQVLAVAFDVTVVGERGETRMTVVSGVPSGT